jgi:hypothetical protein
MLLQCRRLGLREAAGRDIAAWRRPAAARVSQSMPLGRPLPRAGMDVHFRAEADR